MPLLSSTSNGGGGFLLYVCDRFMSVSPRVPSHVPDMLGCWGPPFCGPPCVLLAVDLWDEVVEASDMFPSSVVPLLFGFPPLGVFHQ